MTKKKRNALVYRKFWFIRLLRTFADTLEKHRDSILAYYDYPISTGPLEGTNNKIKTLQRQAYGFRDMQFFKLKIFGLHETKYASMRRLVNIAVRRGEPFFPQNP